MNGYILTTTKNTHGWVIYDNDISMDYQEFFKGQFFQQKEIPLFYTIPVSYTHLTLPTKAEV